MKVSEVIVESVWDTLKAVRSFQGRPGKETTAFRQAAQQAGIDLKPATKPAQPAGTQQTSQQATATTNGPESDISKLVPPGMQFRFQNPDNPGGFIIIRTTGYYYDSLPRNLQGQVRRDKATGLYPVLRPANIQKINKYYDQASDSGSVVEEPAAAL